MAKQYLRAADLIVGTDAGDGLDLSSLRFRFAVKQWDIQTPNNALIRVYNVARATAQRAAKEYTRVVVQAGYQDNKGLIFDGTVTQWRYGRENQTDTFLEIVAAEGDQAHNKAVVSHTLAAGYRANDLAAALNKTLRGYGVDGDYTPDLGGPTYPRGRVLWGMARDHFRDLGVATDTTWTVNGRQSQLIPVKGYLPDEAVVLTAATGMVGLPEQTQDGIVVRCLLNPKLKAGVRVKLDNASVQELRRPVAISAQPGYDMAPKLDADGLYRILAVDHSGDTRGNDWYSEVVTVGLDAAPSIGQVQRGRT